MGDCCSEGQRGSWLQGLCPMPLFPLKGTHHCLPVPLCGPSCCFFYTLAPGSSPWPQQMCERSDKISYIYRAPCPQVPQCRAVGVLVKGP